MYEYVLIRSPNKRKKYRIVTPEFISIDFGANGFSDFSLHKDVDRRARYIMRHRKRENWTRTGINTAGWWSRYLLWNLPTIEDSIKDIEKRFDIKIKNLL